MHTESDKMGDSGMDSKPFHEKVTDPEPGCIVRRTGYKNGRLEVRCRDNSEGLYAYEDR